MKSAKTVGLSIPPAPWILKDFITSGVPHGAFTEPNGYTYGLERPDGSAKPAKDTVTTCFLNWSNSGK